MTSRLTAVDLFAGAGGLTLGLKRAGFTILGAIEIDPIAVETYRLNHPRVDVWQCDIVNVDPIDFQRRLALTPGSLDLLAGCPPCQGFSTMRTLNGSRSVLDVRNDLLFEFLRFARALQPKAIMMENVPGLFVDQRLTELSSVLSTLGYICEARIVDAAEYGVPQRRRRMILLASLQEGLKFPRPSTARRTVRQTIGMLPLPGRAGDQLHDIPEDRAPRIRELIKNIPKDGGSRTSAPNKFQLGCHRRTSGFYDVYGRMAWDRVSPTITTGCHNPSKGRFLHPDQDRAITLREAALLQTFPRDYKFSLRRGKEHAGRLIGNALPPALIQRVAVSVKKHISG